MTHSVDNETIFFYEREHYYLSNFSSFQIVHNGIIFPTAEHLYHWFRFTTSENPRGEYICDEIRRSRSAQDVWELAQKNKSYQRANWDTIKPQMMKRVLYLKAAQHDYVKCKLLQTVGRKLSENSPVDAYWGTGPDGAGQDMLGKLWMELRDEIEASEQRSKCFSKTTARRIDD